MKALLALIAAAGLAGAVFSQQSSQPPQPGAEKGPAARRVVYTKAGFGATIATSFLTLEDGPDHKLTQSFRIDRGQTTDAEFVITEEQIYWQGDERPGQARYTGYSTYLMQGADKVFIRWESDPAPHGPKADGAAPVESGTIVVLGGTGRYQHIRGSGVYHGYAKGPTLEENTLDVSW
jgi:hypothetical protein